MAGPPRAGSGSLAVATRADGRRPSLSHWSSASSKTRFDIDEWASKAEPQGEVIHTLAIPERSRFRQAWNVVLVVLLVYVGTLLPYFVAFYQLRIADERSIADAEVSFWIIDSFFYIDLVLNFFFTYEDASGLEVFDLRKIAKRYLTGRFFLDLIACMPVAFWGAILSAANARGSMSDGGMYKLTRLARLQRASRLTRMASLSRFVDRISSKYSVFMALKGATGIRIMNFACTLFWFVHILACGWYLCAALHQDPSRTWVYRRQLDSAGTLLVEESPEVQWINAMYFVLTVFTTVGFGDIGAVTAGEITYVCFTMVVGAVVHSIIVSEMIGVVTAMDTQQKEASRRMELVDDFASNCDLDDRARESIKTWLRKQAKLGNFRNVFDQDLARSIFLDGTMPNDLLHELPKQLFGGQLLDNSLVKVLRSCQRSVPPRLIISLALSVRRRQLHYEEEVYKSGDAATALFIVEDGTFALVTRIEKRSGSVGQEAPRPSLPGEVEQAGFAPAKMLRGRAGGLGNVSANMFTRSSSVEGEAMRADTLRLVPYKVFRPGSYFGDVELLGKKMRRDTARCESTVGALLSIASIDFFTIIDQWPQFRRVWQAEAARRGKATVAALKHRVQGSLRDAAARRLQAFWREKRERRLRPTAPQEVVGLLRDAALPDRPPRPSQEPVGLARAGHSGECGATWESSGEPEGPICACAFTPCGRLCKYGQGFAEALISKHITALRVEMLEEIRQGFARIEEARDLQHAGGGPGVLV